VVPSTEYMAVFEFDPTATNLPFPYITDDHALLTGNVLCVQVTPLFVDVAATVEFSAIATKVLFPYAPQDHDVLAGRLLDVHVDVFVEYLLVSEVSAIIINVLLPYNTLLQF
jgi:hypothetical protein